MQFSRVDLVPDFEDTETSLPSFTTIREKTLHTLYRQEEYHDKSPKGSVDARIQSLVDLINAHPSFATLSSCSGRIAVFDPSSETIEVEDTADITPEDITAGSGKGGGRWLLASHELIEPPTLLSVLPRILPLQRSTGNVVEHLEPIPTFRFEPLLLHVAAASLTRGQQLLQIALQLGFRESGLVVTPCRVTVAIRSYSLALVVPLPVASHDYAMQLVDESNRRLQVNWKRMDDLYHSISTSLFSRRPMQAVIEPALPDLNLWGHTTACIPSRNDSMTDLLVIGGYGTGPVAIGKSPSTQPKRSESFYRLRKSDSGKWCEQWEQVSLATEPELSVLDGMEVEKIEWLAREGAASCRLNLPSSRQAGSSSLLAIFGGRKGPAHPLGDLMILDTCSFYLCRPLCIRGKAPGPRWGHTFTALSSNRIDANFARTDLAVLIGGRNERSVLYDSIYVLSFVAEGNCLEWRQVYLSSFARFHHAAISVEHYVFVVGGLTNTNSASETLGESETILGFRISDKSMPVKVNAPFALSKRFGLDATIIREETFGSRDMKECHILVSGGVAVSSTNTSIDNVPWTCLRLVQEQIDAWDVVVCAFSAEAALLKETGPLVHHTALPIFCSSGLYSSVICAGGGSSGFAFRPCFARSFRLLFDRNTPKDLASKHNSDMGAENTMKAKASSRSEFLSISSESTVAEVVYVHKRNAKTVKSHLQQASLLDLTRRMAPAAGDIGLPDSSQYIAVPVTGDVISLVEHHKRQADGLQPEWITMVHRCGKQTLPRSTRVFARHKAKAIAKS